MERISTGTGTCHVVALPYPGRGHINPMMNICKLLVSKSPSINITFVVTEEWHGFMSSEQNPSNNIQFRTLPNVIPSETIRALDFAGFVEAVNTKMEAPFEELLEKLESESPVTAIIADSFMAWAVAVGNRRNISLVSFWPMSPPMFSMFYHFDLFVQNRHFPVDFSECGGELVDYIPGLSPIRLRDLPPFLDGNNTSVLDRVLEVFSCVRKAQGLIFNSFDELGTDVTNALKEVLPFPVYSIGPAIPYTTLGEIECTSSSRAEAKMDYYFEWLDSQPGSSVLYVSLGSFLSVSSEQMDELKYGLCESGVRFLWVARGETSRMQEGCGDKGLVVPWCDQLRVLCHPSIGGFWTHCGWNSTLEGVFAGIPMLTFPILFDQFPNRKLIVDDLKVGLNVEKEVKMESMVKREDIGILVKRFMDLNSDGNKEMRRRASELKGICRRALAKGGSSDTNLDSFARDILKSHG